MGSVKKRIEVVAAVISRKALNGPGFEVLAFQRASHDVGGGRWEFPGGKIEADESKETALVREIQEELGVSGQVLGFAAESDFESTDIQIHLSAYFFEVNAWNFNLSDHQALVWVNFEQSASLEWSLPDIPLVPEVFRKLENQLNK